MSKSDLARVTNTQPAAVRRLLTNNERSPRLTTLKTIAEALDCEIRLVPRVNERSGSDAFRDAAASLRSIDNAPFSTILADPPWRFTNRTGKVAPEHQRLSRYDTMTTAEIAALPVAEVAADPSHLYLWVPNALIADGLNVMESWGFTYKANIVWAKRRKDGGPDGRGVGFYFRNVTEILLFGVRGKMRTLQPGRRQVNMIETQKREHSRKPDEQYGVIEDCSPGPYLEMFARYPQKGWHVWGNEADEEITPRGKTYAAYGGD
jgi:N6-adenosine-specific RNA methylase IME4